MHSCTSLYLLNVHPTVHSSITCRWAPRMCGSSWRLLCRLRSLMRQMPCKRN